LAEGLPDNPSAVRRQLAGSCHGCQWLIERWQALGAALEEFGQWTDGLWWEALDLLGLAPKDRDVSGPEALSDGDPVALGRSLIDEQINHLTTRRDRLAEDNDYRQTVAELGLGGSTSPEQRLFRRYESERMRSLRWCYEKLRDARIINGPTSPKTEPAIDLKSAPVLSESSAIPTVPPKSSSTAAGDPSELNRTTEAPPPLLFVGSG